MTPHSRARCGRTSAAAFVNGHDVTGGITTALGGVWDTTGDGVTNTVTPGSDYNFAAGVITDYDVSQAAINHMVRLAMSAGRAEISRRQLDGQHPLAQQP